MATIDSLVEATIVGDDDLFLIDQGGEGKKLKKGNLKIDADNVPNANGGSVQDFIDAQATTVAEIESGMFTETGTILKVNDRDGGLFELKAGNSFDGFGVLSAGLDRVAVLINSKIKPEHMGVISELNEANHLALIALISDGRPIDWGKKPYGITEPVKGSGDTALTIAHPIKWESDGAQVYLDPLSSQQRAVMWLDVAGVDHEIDGQLIVDANSKANRGFWAEYTGLTHAGSFTANGLTAKNIRRTIAFSGGDGIIIEGGFKSVVLENPKVSNVIMAAGAGIEGSQGIRGIGVVRDAVGLYPLYVHIDNPDIETVISEDLDYNWDQDAIAIFGGISSGDVPSFGHVSGGKIKNPGGRGVKCQTTDGLVEAVTFIRDTGLNSPKDPEVDFLYGGGTVRNCQHVYSDTVPSDLYSGASATTDNTPALQIRGGKVTLKTPSNLTLTRIANLFARKANYGQPIISDVEVVGGVLTEIALIRVADANTTMTLENISANVSDQGFTVLAATGSNQACRVSATNLNNTGSSVPLYRHRVTGNIATAIVNAINCNNGWASSGGALNSTSSAAPIALVAPIWQGNYDRCGSAKMLGQRTGSAADFRIPLLATSNVSIVLINVAGVDNLNAIISTSSAGPSLLSGGTGFTLGTTADPGAGNYRLWVDTATGELVYKTSLATVRSVTAMVFGG